MTVTINATGSWHPHTKSSAYAVYIRNEKHTLKTSGMLKGYVQSSLEAELKAAANGVYLLLNNLDRFRYISVINVVVNSANAQHLLMNAFNITPSRDIEKVADKIVNNLISIRDKNKVSGYYATKRYKRIQITLDKEKTSIERMWCLGASREQLNKQLK